MGRITKTKKLLCEQGVRKKRIFVIVTLQLRQNSREGQNVREIPLPPHH